MPLACFQCADKCSSETCQSHVPTLWCDFYSCFRINWFLKIGFSPKARGFYPFGDATALAGEGGVRGVGWLIQASAWNQTCHSANDRCEALASPKGCFLCFYFCPPVFIHWTEKLPNFSFNHLVCLHKTKGGWIRISRLFCHLLWRWRGLNPRPNVELISFLHA